MNVTAKAIFLAKDAQTFDNALRRVIGTLQNPARKKQALDVIAPVKLHSKVGQFARPKRSARNIVGAAARAISAIEDAYVGEQHLQKRDAAPIGRKAMAYARRCRVPKGAHARIAIDAARCAGDIVFRSIGEQCELCRCIHCAPSYKNERLFVILKRINVRFKMIFRENHDATVR